MLVYLLLPSTIIMIASWAYHRWRWKSGRPIESIFEGAVMALSAIQFIIVVYVNIMALTGASIPEMITVAFILFILAAATDWVSR